MRTEPGLWIRWWPALLLVLFTEARADHDAIPIGVSQYIRFTVSSPSEVKLSYSILVGVRASVSLLQEADLDHSGKLDEMEQRALGQRFAREVAARLDLSLDGRRVTLRFDEVRTAFESDSVGVWPFSVHLTSSLATKRAGSHEVSLRGVVPFQPLAETLISASAVQPVRLLSAKNAKWTADGVEANYFGSDGTDRPMSFTFSGQPSLLSARALVRGAAAFGVVICAIGMALLRRRPRPLDERTP